jgi:4-alpha-glucanotransferase
MTGKSVVAPPFPREYRASGILLHVTSLPSRYGVGDFGPSALGWIDRLEQASQSWWQVLPLNPAGDGNSPYSAPSAFAANGLLISPDWLVEDDLLKTNERTSPSFPSTAVDYEAVVPFKSRLIETAWTNFKAGARPDLRSSFERFRDSQSHWLEDYALFLALKDKFNGAHYLEWPVELATREPASLDRVRRELADQIGLLCFRQFLAFGHTDRLKAYARSKGVRLIGDLPFYVAPDSSDVWAHPELFLLDEQHRPRAVSGVPPDYFSASGQLWGNPVYDWDALRQTGYRWWINRLRSLLAHVDVIRLDHFRAFAQAWHVPAGAADAKVGRWVEGPGADFFREAQKELGALPFIAEDLGQITPDVYRLRDQFHFPGMRVLQFAFDGHSDNPHLPENFVTNAVTYTGTHDNPTTRGWIEDLPDDQRKGVLSYMKQRGAKSNEPARELMELAWSSVAALSIAPLQDLLNLGAEARMNVPGRPDGNWRWRCTEEMLRDPAFEWLDDLTRGVNRSIASIAQDAKTDETAARKSNTSVAPVVGF